MPKPNHTCIVCGDEYYACDGCQHEKNFTPWRAVVCSRSCFLKYATIKSYTSNLATKEETQKELLREGVDPENLDGFTNGVRTVITEVFSVPEPVKDKPQSNKKKQHKK